MATSPQDSHPPEHPEVPPGPPPMGEGAPPPPPPGYGAYPGYPGYVASSGVSGGPRRRSRFVRLGLGLLLVLLAISILVNLYLGGIVYSVIGGGLHENTYRAGDSANRIVILPIDGMINGKQYAFVSAALRKLRNDPPKAVVLRVNSPGGGVTAADEIWRSLEQFKKQTKTPIVASFGGLAASGGYYVAMAADKIVAERTCITGSIGVIAFGFSVKGLLDKVGVTPEVIRATRSTQKDLVNPFKDWTPADRQRVQAILDHAYAGFVDVVAQGRPALSRQQVLALATGRTFNADEAKQAGLVDAVGYLDDAVALAKKQAGMAASITPEVTVMRQSHGFSLLGLIGITETQPPAASRLTLANLRQAMTDLTVPHIAYFCPLGQ